MLSSVIAALLHASTYAAPLEPCPRSAEEWESWRTRVLASLTTPDDLADGRLAPLEKCGISPEIRACMAPLLRAAEGSALHPRQSAHGRYDIPAAKYFDEKRLAHPEMFSVPDAINDPELLRRIADPKLSKEAVRARLRELASKIPGAKVLEYQSRFVPGDLWVIHLPGPDYDRWLHLDLMGGKEPIRHLLQLTVQKKPKPTLFFNPLEWGEESGQGARWVRPKADARGTRCLDCHRNGPIHVLPPEGAEPVAVFPESPLPRELVSWMNQKLDELADAKIDSAPTEGFGPPLGEVNPPSRTDEFVAGCAKRQHLELPLDGIRRVRKAMNCASCHDGSVARPYDVMLLKKQLGETVLFGVIESGHMPPKADLSRDERQVLAGCLMDEYLGGLNFHTNAKGPGTFLRWLAERKCSTPQPSYRNPNGHGAPTDSAGHAR